MQDKKSLSFLDEKEHLSSRDKLANWMCVQHNVIKIEKLHPGFDGLPRDQAQKVYDTLFDEDKIFACTNENLKKRWGPLG